MKTNKIFLLIPLLLIPSCNKDQTSSQDSSDSGSLSNLDTDFDGCPDNIDINPNSSLYQIKMVNSYDGSRYCMNYSMDFDYRKFVDLSNTTYHNDLDKIGLTLATNIYEECYLKSDDFYYSSVTDKNALYNQLGFENYVDIDLQYDFYNTDSNDTTFFSLATHSFEYNSKTYNIAFAIFKGTNGSNEWISNFDVGLDDESYYSKKGYDHPEWIHKENHKGFDIAANRSINNINTYLLNNSLDAESTILFICGHSRGAAMANLVGKYFEDLNTYKSFTYTYAAPQTTGSSSYSTYQTIYNIINTDDVVPGIMEGIQFHRFGTDVKKSVDDDLKEEWQGQVRKINGLGKEVSFSYITTKGWNNHLALLGNNRECLYEISDDNVGLYETFASELQRDTRKDEVQNLITGNDLDDYFEIKTSSFIENENEVFELKVINCPYTLIEAASPIIVYGTGRLPKVINLLPLANNFQEAIDDVMGVENILEAVTYNHAPLAYALITNNM